MAFTFLQSIYKLRLICFKNVVSSNLKDIARTHIDCKNLNCKGFQHRTTLTLLDIQNQIDQGLKDVDNINFDILNEAEKLSHYKKPLQKLPCSPVLPCGVLKYDDQPSVCSKVEKVEKIEKIVNC
jgi:hypothetical protein